MADEQITRLVKKQTFTQERNPASHALDILAFCAHAGFPTHTQILLPGKSDTFPVFVGAWMITCACSSMPTHSAMIQRMQVPYGSWPRAPEVLL